MASSVSRHSGGRRSSFLQSGSMEPSNSWVQAPIAHTPIVRHISFSPPRSGSAPASARARHKRMFSHSVAARMAWTRTKVQALPFPRRISGTCPFHPSPLHVASPCLQHAAALQSHLLRFATVLQGSLSSRRRENMHFSVVNRARSCERKRTGVRCKEGSQDHRARGHAKARPS